MADHSAHDDHGGIHRDLPRLIDRRQALRWMGGASLASVLAACGVSEPTTTSGSSGTLGAGAEIPSEFAGPFPADGTNGPNALAESGVVKADLTTSFGSFSGTAEGIPLTLDMWMVDAETGAPLPGTAVYVWHCTADGRYSVYEIEHQNYLRGLQVADGAGLVRFTTIYPGCYPGRWPHTHFEIFFSLDEANVGSDAFKTSQMAFPREASADVYGDARYGDSAACLDELQLGFDVVFEDSADEQLAVVTGSNDAGYTAELVVRV